MIKVDPRNPQRGAIAQAAEVLKKGGLVAFPTETVYGLGADVFNLEAINRLFQAKGRLFTNPLPIQIAEINQLETLVPSIPQKARELIQRFWPGPLTLVFPRSERVSPLVTAGKNTVGIRIPRNEVALALLRAFGGPLAVPSANPSASGSRSNTTGEQVVQDFKGKIDLILDAGSTEIGMESTVLDISTQPPAILRLGAITAEQLKEVLGEVILT